MAHAIVEADLPVVVEQCIFIIRGQKVMLDSDLAGLYGVDVKHLNRQVRRNLKRFPADFMFELRMEELERLRCQNGTSKKGSPGRGGARYRRLAFTEQGVAMLSTVLNSERAIQQETEEATTFRVDVEFVPIFAELGLAQLFFTNTVVDELLKSPDRVLARILFLERLLVCRPVLHDCVLAVFSPKSSVKNPSWAPSRGASD